MCVQHRCACMLVRGDSQRACSARLKRRSSTSMLEMLALAPRLRNWPRPACSLRYSASACLMTLRRERRTTLTPCSTISAATRATEGSSLSSRDSRALRPKATASVRRHPPRLRRIASSCPKTEARCSAACQSTHSLALPRCGVQSVRSQRSRSVWSATLAIEMLSMGSKPMAQTSGSAPSSCISQEEPELDSKSTTNGTTAGSGTAAAGSVVVAGRRCAIEV